MLILGTVSDKATQGPRVKKRIVNMKQSLPANAARGIIPGSSNGFDVLESAKEFMGCMFH